MKNMVMVFSWVSLALAVITSQAAMGEAIPYEEGTHYVALPVPIKTRQADKIEVAEYFSYGCPHCYQFEPLIGAWKQRLADDVEFSRTPAIWNKDYQVYAQTYLTAQALDVLDQIHVPLFDAIHNKRRRLNEPEQMAEFFGEMGIDPMAFARTYSSFGVRASYQQAEAKGRAYRSSGVPAIVVNGKYRIEGSMAGSSAEMLKIADYLVAKERSLMTNVPALKQPAS
ncbi:MAG: thiol:disulfide interchange protein DsbA/DsbL [SAR86 cluster bacterium]|jgi:protein dithiol oxidoreductase (disulfide-forming)|tara:strand:- start:16111 stop:16788 length:678 start_codon:yes stop_codon:yes gene_type:complete